MQARYQHPVTGRFLSIDPVDFLADGRTGMVNRYSYVANDLMSMYDPNGEFGIFGEAIGAVAGGVGAYIASRGKADFKTIVAGAAAGAVVGTINPFGSAGVGAGTAASVATQTTLRIGVEAARGAGASALGQTIGGASENLKEGQGLVDSVVSAAQDIDGGAVAGAAVGSGIAKGFWLTTTYAIPAGSVGEGVTAELATEAAISAVVTGGSEYYGAQMSGDENSDAGEYDASGLACYGKDIDC